MLDERESSIDEREWLAQRFELERGHLRAVAYRMLGSFAEADDAVQDAWLRLSRAEAGDIDNLGAWLTTVVARVCLNKLRSRRVRREEPLSLHLPDPLVSTDDSRDPEHEAVMADSVGLALQVVLDMLSPAERLAFVLHDMFDVPFDEIAKIAGRSPDADRQLASRARRRVQGAAPSPEGAVVEQRRVVDAFFAAARGGDFQALVAVLDPEVVLRADAGPSFRRLIRGAEAVARAARIGARPSAALRPVLVNGAVGVVVYEGGRPTALMGFTVRGGKILEIDAIADRPRLAALDLPGLT